MNTYKVKFLPDNKEVTAKQGETVLSCAVSAGIYINSACGGEGVCGRCLVIIKNGKFETQPAGILTTEQKKQGYVLACLTIVEDNLEVFVPPESRLEMEKTEADEIEPPAPVLDESAFLLSPLTAKLFLKLPPPTLNDSLSDLDRLVRALEQRLGSTNIQVGLSNIKGLGRLLRESDWQVTATVGIKNDITDVIQIEPGDTQARNYGIAFDIGTTTVSGQLVDLGTKAVLGTRAGYNKQAAFGSDVISRIIYASEPDGLDKLHEAVLDNINEIIKELVSIHKVSLNDITAVMAAGNTTMIHLLLKIDPAYIRREPYVPTANFMPVIKAQEAGIKINTRGLLACIPGVSSYVGGDITAGVVACGISASDELTLLIDVGTNGEIALGNREWLACCAASAGPAFEGSGVSCGMRAAKGAIQKVKIKKGAKDFDVEISTIANEKPKGICGSGYIDLLAELRSNAIIDKNGKLNRALGSKRVREGLDGLEFIVSDDIVITEADIENLKRSKGAIYSATYVLLKKIGIEMSDLKHIYIAGGFGTCIDIENGIKIGLWPDIDRNKFKFVGNSSLTGCREILLSSQTMKNAEEIARKMTYVELCVEPVYMDEYIASLFFPHTDLNRFPTVRV